MAFPLVTVTSTGRVLRITRPVRRYRAEAAASRPIRGLSLWIDSERPICAGESMTLARSEKPRQQATLGLGGPERQQAGA